MIMFSVERALCNGNYRDSKDINMSTPQLVYHYTFAKGFTMLMIHHSFLSYQSHLIITVTYRI